jgi:hypothetical protein
MATTLPGAVAGKIIGPGTISYFLAVLGGKVVSYIPLIGSLVPPLPTPLMTNRIASLAVTPVLGAASGLVGAIFGLFSIIVLLYSIFSCCGLTLQRGGSAAEAGCAGYFEGAYASVRGWRTNQIFDSEGGSAAVSLKKLTPVWFVRFFVVDLLGTLVEFVLLFIQGLLDTLIRLASLSLPIFVLYLLTTTMLPLQTNPAGLFSAVDGTETLAVNTMNAASGLANFVSSFCLAVLLMPWNAVVHTGFTLLEITFAAFSIGDSFGQTGDIGSNIASGVSSSTQFLDFGRRLEEDAAAQRRLAGDSGRNYAGFLTTLTQYSILLAQILDLVGSIFLLFYALILAVIAPIIGIFVAAVADIAQIVVCAVVNGLCAFLEALGVALSAVVTLLNVTIITGINGIINSITSAFGASNSAVIPFIPAPDVGCSADVLASVPCSCSVFFTNVRPCDGATYTCSVDSVTGLWTEYTNSNGVTTPGTANANKAVACTRSRRMLSTFGYVLNMQAAGTGLVCHTACLNNTAFEVCPFVPPPPLSPSWFTPSLPAPPPPHALTYLGQCESGSGRRLESGWESHPHVEFRHASLFLQKFFEVAAPPVVRSSSAKRRDLGGGGGGMPFRTGKWVAGIVESTSSMIFPSESIAETSAAAASSAASANSLLSDPTPGVVNKMKADFAKFGLAQNSEFPEVVPLPDTALSRYVDMVKVAQVVMTHSSRRRATHASSVSSSARAWADVELAKQRAVLPSGRVLRLLAGIESVKVAAHYADALSHENVPILHRLLVTEETVEGGSRRSMHDRPVGDSSAARIAHALRRNLWGQERDEEHTGTLESATHFSRRLMMDAYEELHKASRLSQERLARRRELTQVSDSGLTTRNIFVSPEKAACLNYLCPDSSCVVDRKRCRTPTVWTLGVAVDYISLEASLFASDLDERVVLARITKCRNGLKAAPHTDPFNLYNLGKNVLEDPSIVWCSPMLAPFAYKFPTVDANLREFMLATCGDVGCSCDSYYDGAYDVTNSWFRDMPFFVLSRIHDGLLTFQWFFSTWVAVPLGIGAAWEKFFSPLYAVGLVPLWFQTLFSTQGQLGSYNTQLLCAITHIPSFLYIIFLLLIFTCIFLGFRRCILYVGLKLFSLSILPFELFISYMIDTAGSGDRTDAAKAHQIETWRAKGTTLRLRRERMVYDLKLLLAEPKLKAALHARFGEKLEKEEAEHKAKREFVPAPAPVPPLGTSFGQGQMRRRGWGGV